MRRDAMRPWTQDVFFLLFRLFLGFLDDDFGEFFCWFPPGFCMFLVSFFLCVWMFLLGVSLEYQVNFCSPPALLTKIGLLAG